MKKIIKLFSVFLCLIFLAKAASANEFLFYKSITAPENIKNEVGAATLDSQIYGNTNNDFANLRIYDSQDNEVPFVVRKLRGREKLIMEQPVAMKILSLEELPENRLSIVLERPEEKNKPREDSIPSDVIIKTSNNNFEKTVSVFGSDDKQQWQLLVENQPIFDYSRFIDLRNTSVSFEKKRFKYYKLVIDNVAQALVSAFSQIFTKYAQGKVNQEYASFTRYEGVLRIESLDFLSKQEKAVEGELEMVPYPLDIAEVKINQKDKTSEIYLNSQREPLTRMLLKIENQNFKRKIIVEANNSLDSQVTWVRIASSEIFNINAGDFHKQNLKIDLGNSENRYKQYRLRIFNYDNPLIEVDSVQAEGAIHEIVFFHNNQTRLKAYYGGSEIKLPQYDVSFVLAEIPLKANERWQLSPERTNENAAAKRKPIITQKQLLIIALTLMVIVLGALIVSSVKKVDEISE
ncbi:MAG: DUF3999 family protein [Candidatus Omnitrophica bacterium]|nr:DUF3999 family protein [Candidatus Omnitrophota bacterium]